MSRRTLLAVMAMCVMGATAGYAAVKPHALFSSGMVLQRDAAIPVWGTATNGEKVTVSFVDQNVGVIASNGHWSVRLSPLKAGGPFTMTIAGENTVTITNVLVGEVWLCSGQSNMEFPLRNTDNAKEVLAAATNHQLRLFAVPRNSQDKPQTTVAATWETCKPATAAPFSGVAYYFGLHLQQTLGVPVGLINASVGGTPAEAWTPPATFQADTNLHYVLSSYAESLKTYPARLAEYRKGEKERMAQYETEALAARKEGKPEPGKPAAPVKPSETYNKPSCLYNGMIAPLCPYAIRGVIWYQGEANRERADKYAELFGAMIGGWRAAWGQGAFPFLFVQLAPRDLYPPELREAQLRVWQKVPNTAMAVITDWGMAHDSHPRNKKPVGDRLALAARALVYGEKIEYSGPVYESMKVEQGEAILSFTHVGGGFVAKGGDLKGFVVAGSSGVFMPARARIEGDKVVVSSSMVGEPVAVRYGWENVPDVNLFNREGFPASPFRTDVP